MWPALVAAGAQVAGGLISSSGQQNANAANVAMARETNNFNAFEAQKNRDWQERMSNTSWQRGVADMRAAGLNPALAYQQGGAGTPSGGSASGVSTRLDNARAPIGSAIANGISTAVDVANQVKQGKVLEATAANQKAQAYTNAMEGSLKALDNARLSDDDIQNLLKRTVAANVKNIETSATEHMARAGAENATAAYTQQTTGQQRMTPGWQKTVQPWINDAKGAAQLLRTFIAATDPLIN